MARGVYPDPFPQYAPGPGDTLKLAAGANVTIIPNGDQLVIASTAIGGSGSAGFPASHADASLGGDSGQTLSQTIPATTFTQINLPVENADTGNNFNNTAAAVGGINAYCYRPPANGVYLCVAKLRIVDTGLAAVTQIGIGVHNANADNPAFEWNAVQATGTAFRMTMDYQRIIVATTTDQLRLFVWGSASFPVSTANLSIVRIA